MPKSKHRRKPGEKAVAHPGRGKPGRPATLSWLDELEEASGVSGLPLFDWAVRAPVSVGSAASGKDGSEPCYRGLPHYH
jgi:hypothetical protein